jgi:Zn-dependent M28 family amino/carboxypeptidase
MFTRLRAAGETVTLRADIANTLTLDTLRSENTIAEIRGTEHPEEVVLLGAHLDSWDLATGATDNGAGAIAVLEAARILAASKVRPARTIRFALFTGEEEGLMGSAAYAEAHANELGQYQVVLVLDNGTGRITGIALQGRRELHDAWASLLSPIAQLGPFSIRSANKGGTDHLSFLPYGVPAFNYDQTTLGYNHTHHSQVDTYDHVSPSDLAQAATVMAVNAYQWASADTLLARGPIQ